MVVGTRDNYLAFRSAYAPQSVSLIIVAESPPASGLYFYNPSPNRSPPR